MALLDTHTWSWMLTVDPILTPSVREALDAADQLYLSPVSFYEIAQKVRLGKWPLMEPFVENLPKLALDSGLAIASVSAEITLLAGTLNWPHRDPFDRMLAATALVHGWVLISADTAFDSLIGLRRVW